MIKMKTYISIRRILSIGMVCSSLFVWNGCGDEMGSKGKNRGTSPDTSDELYQFITEGLGFRPEDVVDFGDTYVAEGDITFDKRSYNIPELFRRAKSDGSKYIHKDPESLGNANGRKNQRATSLLYNVGRTQQRNISVSIKSNVPAALRPYIEVAIHRWNNASSCTEISFVLVDTPSSTIEFRDDDNELSDQFGVYAQADFPSETKSSHEPGRVGTPGRYVRLNTSLIQNSLPIIYPNSEVRGQVLIALMQHELGHTIGFMHSDVVSGGTYGNIVIPGTPASDAQSIMLNGNPVAINLSNYDFSTNDKNAIRNFYPKLTNTSCLAQLYYYFSSSLGDSFFTTQLNEKGTDHYGYNTDPTVICYVHTSERSGTVPLYRYISHSLGDHKYSTDSNAGGGSGGYELNGTAFYIHTASGGGRTALHEYYSNSATNHHYTINQREYSWLYVSGNSGLCVLKQVTLLSYLMKG
jgi:hypothetical protein